MNKRIAAGCLLLVAVIFMWIAYNGGTYTIEITQQEARAHIDAALRQRAADESKNLNIESANLRFVDNRIRIDARISARLKGQAIEADVETTGEPIYRDGKFYFHPTSLIRFSEVRIGKADGDGKPLGRTAELLKQRVEKFAAEHGLGDVTEALKAEFRQWASAAAQKTLETAFALKPIYVLKDNANGVVVNAMLDKVEVVGDKLEITLSLVRFGYSIAIAAACLLLAIGLVAFSFVD